MFDNLPEDKKIIIFDGVCNLCNSSINYVIDMIMMIILDLLHFNLI